MIPNRTGAPVGCGELANRINRIVSTDEVLSGEGELRDGPGLHRHAADKSGKRALCFPEIGSSRDVFGGNSHR